VIVVLDVGNTNLTLAVVADDDVASTSRAPTPIGASPDDLAATLDDLLGAEGANFGHVERLIVVSVVPGLTDAIRELAERRDIPLLVADETTIPMDILVANPESVGDDRLVNGYAASQLHGTPAIVVDLGTATTFDVVNGEGAFIGGAIAAGAGLSVDALARGTAQLPRVPLVMPEHAIGRDTVGAMQSGAIIGHSGLVLVLIRAIAAELAAAGTAQPKVVLTGGLSGTDWAQAIPDVDVIDPYLTLEGLVLLHKEIPMAGQATAAGQATPAVPLH
jgi:type III pantothenate kinase